MFQLIGQAQARVLTLSNMLEEEERARGHMYFQEVQNKEIE